jgi:hypothetical protein
MVQVNSHFGSAFATSDLLWGLFRSEKCALRDRLWIEEVAERFKTGPERENASKRAYMLQRIHNRYSRLMPWLIAFISDAGGVVDVLLYLVVYLMYVMRVCV